MKYILTLIAICLAVTLAHAFDPTNTNHEFIKVYKYDSGTWGDDSKIHFDHDLHVERNGRECATCHNTFLADAENVVRRSYTLYNGTTLNTGHTVCKDCHAAEGASEVCTFCHNNTLTQ